jgi:hypothetical protein
VFGTKIIKKVMAIVNNILHKSSDILMLVFVLLLILHVLEIKRKYYQARQTLLQFFQKPRAIGRLNIY